MPTLDRARFEHLYLHANSIAELALLRALDKASSSATQPTPAQRAATAALVHDINHPDPETFDWSALQGLYGFDGPLDATPSAAAPPPAHVPSFDEMVGIDDDDDLDAPVDIARYLARVDEARPALRPRVDDCFARADLAALEAALATLPPDMPSLTGALTPDAFTRWLALYENRHAGLQAAVLGIRRLEPLL
jgi:hypothetical protein